MLQLGDFVIDKRDLFQDNHPIWLIDTTNMLQKYERIDNKEHNGKPVHTAMNTVSTKLTSPRLVLSTRANKSLKGNMWSVTPVSLFCMFK